MHHHFSKVHLANRKQITGKKASGKRDFSRGQTFPTLFISEKLEAENLISYKTVSDLDLHFSDIIPYANRRVGIPNSV